MTLVTGILVTPNPVHTKNLVFGFSLVGWLGGGLWLNTPVVKNPITLPFIGNEIGVPRWGGVP